MLSTKKETFNNEWPTVNSGTFANDTQNTSFRVNKTEAAVERSPLKYEVQ